MLEEVSRPHARWVPWIARGLGPASLLVLALALHGAQAGLAREGAELSRLRADVKEGAVPRRSPVALFWSGRRVESRPEPSSAPAPGVADRVREALDRVREKGDAKGVDVEAWMLDDAELATLDTCEDLEDPACDALVARVREGCKELGARCGLRP